MYKSGDIRTLLLVPNSTFNEWCKEFASYLSPTATPDDNRKRRFTDDDIKVFTLIQEMKQGGKFFEDIHASLRAGQRGEMPSMNSLQTLPRTSLAVAARVRELEGVIEVMSREINALRIDKALLVVREAEIKTKEDTIARLNQEIGSLKTRLGE